MASIGPSLKIILICAGIAGIVTIGAKYLIGTNEPTKETGVQQEVMTIQGQETIHQFVPEFEKLIMNKSSNLELMKALDENIMKLTDKEANIVIDGLMYCINGGNSMINSDTEFMAEVQKIKDVDIEKINNLEGITDPELLKNIKNFREEGYVFIKKDGRVISEIDYPRIVEAYGDYVTDDLGDMLEFYNLFHEDSYLNTETQELIYDNVINKILYTENYMKDHEGSTYYGSMASINEFYTMEYFGGHDVPYVYDENNTLRSSAVTSYEKVIKEYPGTQLAERAEAYLAKIEKIGMQKTPDTMVFLMDILDLDQGVNFIEEEDTLSQKNPNDNIDTKEYEDKSPQEVVKELLNN